MNEKGYAHKESSFNAPFYLSGKRIRDKREEDRERGGGEVWRG